VPFGTRASGVPARWSQVTVFEYTWLGVKSFSMRYMGHALGWSPELQPLQTTSPLELVTVKKGDVPPISTLHARVEVLRTEAVILTMAPGP